MQLHNAPRDLLILFGGGWGNFGIDLKTYLEVCRELRVDTLTLSDPNFNWYHYGVSEELNTVSKSIAGIKEIADKYTRVFTTGLSIGGYAAVWYGTLLNCDTILSFGPQTSIDPLLAHPKAYPYLQGCYERLQGKGVDLREHLQSTPYTSKIILVAGSEHESDCRWCDRLSGLNNVDQVRLPTHKHNLPEYLYNSGELVSFMREKLLLP